MNKTIATFLILSVLSTVVLVVFSGGIFVESQISPVTEVAKNELDSENDAMTLKNEDKEYSIYKDNRIEQGHYIHYNEERIKEWEINFDVMQIKNSKTLDIENPICFYYTSKTTDSENYKTAEKYKITAKKAAIQKENDDFSILTFSENVKIHGYDAKESIISEASCDYVDIGLADKEIYTESPVEMLHQKDLKILSSGIKVKTAANSIEFLRNVDLVINTEDKKQKKYEVKSKSKGKLYLNKISDDIFVLEQHQDVEAVSQKAKINCNILSIQLKRTKEKIFVQKLSASQDVFFEDNHNALTCDYFVQDSSNPDREEIIMQGKSSIVIKGDFTLLTGEESQKIEEIKQKKKIQEMRASADKKIRWVKTYNTLFTLESIFLENNAHLFQVVEANQNTEIKGNYLKLDLVIKLDKTNKEKREPIYLEAKEEAFYQDKDVSAQADIFIWKKLALTKDNLVLQGKKNQVKLFQIQTSDLDGTKNNENQSKEDIWITTESDINITRNFTDNKKYFCHAKKNVHIDRVIAEKKVGSFDAQDFAIEVHEDTNKKMNLQKAVAKDNVVYRDEEFYASGNLLTWEKNKENQEEITLSQNNPTIFIKKLKMTDDLLPIDKEQKQKENNALEDVEIKAKTSIVVQKQPGTTKYHCQAFDNVEIFRYQTDTKISTGKFTTEYLSLDVAKNNTETKSQYELEKLFAKKNVYIQDNENIATGQNLSIIKIAEGQLVTLWENATVKNNKAQISANKIVFNTAQKTFSADKNVHLASEKAQGQGDILIYDLKEKIATITGTPAHFVDIPGKENQITAQKIIFNSNTNKAFAYDNVILNFQGKSGELIALDVKKSNNNENSKSKKKYQLTCAEAEVTFAAQKEASKSDSDLLGNSFPGNNLELTEFTAKNNVVLQNQENPKEKATGTELYYSHALGRVVLSGNPAHIYQDDNEMISHKFEFFTAQKEAIGYGPLEMYISQKEAKNSKSTEKISFSSGDKKIKVNCQGQIHYVEKDQKIKLSKNVLVTRDNKTLEAQKMDIILYDNNIKEIIAYDKVILTSGTNKAYGSQLRWNEEAQQIFMTDYPHVIFKGADTTINVPILYYELKQDRFYTKGRSITAEREAVDKKR